MKKASNIIKAVIIAVILIVILIFSFQNLNTVQVDFFNLKSKELPLFIILLGVLILGILTGYLIGLISGSKISSKKMEKINILANEKIADAEGKVLSLKKEIEDKKPQEKTL